jgi:hypothetical protein
MQDSALRADAKKRNATIDPTPGAELQKIIQKIYATPKSIIKEAKNATKGYKKLCKKNCKKKKKKKKKKSS